MHDYGQWYCWLIIIVFPFVSGCPEAVKVLVGNKSDLSPEVDVSQIKVRSITSFEWVYQYGNDRIHFAILAVNSVAIFSQSLEV